MPSPIPPSPLRWALVVYCLAISSTAARAEELPGTKPLTMQGDLAAQMVAGIDRYLMRELDVRRVHLHPSEAGRHFYPAFGFEPSDEMELLLWDRYSL